LAAVAAAIVPAPLLRLGPLMLAQAVTNLAYPVADLTLLIVLATVGGVTRLRVDVRLALLGLGLGITLVTDLAYLVLDLAGRYHDSHPVDLGWLLALVPLAAAASLGDTTPAPPIPARRAGRTRGNHPANPSTSCPTAPAAPRSCH
jgi:hypothetical protein